MSARRRPDGYLHLEPQTVVGRRDTNPYRCKEGLTSGGSTKSGRRSEEQRAEWNPGELGLWREEKRGTKLARTGPAKAEEQPRSCQMDERRRYAGTEENF